MLNFAKKTTIALTALAAVAMALPAVSTDAAAGHRHSHGHAAAAGIAGLAIGTMLGAAAAQPRYYDRGYYEPAPRRYYRPHRVYYAPAPWTRDWYAYCASKYRSFDPHSGTFQPYRGPRQLCR